MLFRASFSFKKLEDKIVLISLARVMLFRDLYLQQLRMQVERVLISLARVMLFRVPGFVR